jgi:hypothetical protein
MRKSEFYNIVKKDDIQVSIPHTSHFTLGTSPYYAHQHALGIDIYHSLLLDNYEALSPISGEIIKIKSLLAPKPKFMGGIDKDFIILVRNPHNPDTTYKILHVEPNHIQVGEHIEIGDPIGKTIRNGYFAYWSSPHLHLEIRPSSDAIRASGGKSFSLAFNSMKERVFREEKKVEKIHLKINSVFPEFFLGQFQEDLYINIDPIFGVKANFNQLSYLRIFF